MRWSEFQRGHEKAKEEHRHGKRQEGPARKETGKTQYCGAWPCPGNRLKRGTRPKQQQKDYLFIGAATYLLNQQDTAEGNTEDPVLPFFHS